MTSVREYAELQALAHERRPQVVLVLGSGLQGLADHLQDVVELPFGQVPGLTATGVAGHRGTLLLGQWADVAVLVFAGRLHFYEGHPWRRVVQPIHIAHELGAEILITTNAAGGIRDDLQPGDLMAIGDHLDGTRPAWWRGLSQPRTSPYSPRLLTLLQHSAQQLDCPLPTGVYAQLTGPCYETAAEIRALRLCGAAAVGMSTAREIETGRELGMQCAAISCITNKAAGLSSQAIHHEEVIETGRKVQEKMIGVLETFLRAV